MCVCVCVFTSLSLISAGISMEGIYRVSPSLALVNKLRAEFDKGEHHEMNCLPPSHLPSLPPSYISLSLFLSVIHPLTCFPSSHSPLHLPSDAEAVDMHTSEPRVFSAALKLYFRELPTPIMTYELYDDFIAAGS